MLNSVFRVLIGFHTSTNFERCHWAGSDPSSSRVRLPSCGPQVENLALEGDAIGGERQLSRQVRDHWFRPQMSASPGAAEALARLGLARQIRPFSAILTPNFAIKSSFKWLIEKTFSNTSVVQVSQFCFCYFQDPSISKNSTQVWKLHAGKQLQTCDFLS